MLRRSRRAGSSDSGACTLESILSQSLNRRNLESIYIATSSVFPQTAMACCFP